MYRVQRVPAPILYRKKSMDTPAIACKNAKRIFTVLTGNFPSNRAPTTPPAVTPIAVGISTEKSYSPLLA